MDNLINNINHRYIIYDDDLFNMYEKLKDFEKMDLFEHGILKNLYGT